MATKSKFKRNGLPADLARHLENKSVYQGQAKLKGWHLGTWTKKSRPKRSYDNPHRAHRTRIKVSCHPDQ